MKIVTSLIASLILSAPLYAAALVVDLEVYWAFEDNLIDSHTNNIDLTDQGSIEFGSGRVQNAALFSGDDKLFSNSFITEMGVASSSSIQFWIKTNDLGGTLLRKDNTGSGWTPGESTYYLQQIGGSGSMSAVRNSGGWARTDGSPNLANDSWRHLVYVKNGTVETYYIDGISVPLSSSAFHNSDNTSSKVYLGWTSGNDGSNTYSGLMDEVAIWSRAVTPEEVTELYNNGNGLSYTQLIPEPSSFLLILLSGLLTLGKRKRHH